MGKVSVICCYNNEKVYENMLLRSLEKQSITPEIIALDNSDFTFKSAAEALNFASTKASGDYLVFAHQDIDFNDHLFLEKVINYLEELSPSIVGIAGVANDSNGVYTNMKHGEDLKFAGKNRVEFPVLVSTLDEVFIAVERNLFLQYKFDEDTCNNWHLYAVELCLTMGGDNIPSYVVPSNVYHKSSGVLNNDYYNTLGRLVKKHKENYEKILTTCSVVPTKSIPYNLFRVKKNMSFLVRDLKKRLK